MDLTHPFPKALSRSGRLAAAALVAAFGCSGSASPDGAVIDREVFVETYADLRRTAMDSEDRVLSEDERAEVLARNGVTTEELFAFADEHGRDIDFMRAVWDDIEQRLDERRPGSAER